MPEGRSYIYRGRCVCCVCAQTRAFNINICPTVVTDGKGQRIYKYHVSQLPMKRLRSSSYIQQHKDTQCYFILVSFIELCLIIILLFGAIFYSPFNQHQVNSLIPLFVINLGHKDVMPLPSTQAKLGLDGSTPSLNVPLWQDFHCRSPNPMQRDRQTGQEGSLLPVSCLPRSALVGGIQGPCSCKQKPDPVRKVWVSPPRRPADDTRYGPALGTGLI